MSRTEGRRLAAMSQRAAFYRTHCQPKTRSWGRSRRSTLGTGRWPTSVGMLKIRRNPSARALRQTRLGPQEWCSLDARLNNISGTYLQIVGRLEGHYSSLSHREYPGMQFSTGVIPNGREILISFARTEWTRLGKSRFRPDGILK